MMVRVLNHLLSSAYENTKPDKKVVSGGCGA